MPSHSQTHDYVPASETSNPRDASLEMPSPFHPITQLKGGLTQQRWLEEADLVHLLSLSFPFIVAVAGVVRRHFVFEDTFLTSLVYLQFPFHPM